jgi:hypothetical protein
LSRDEEAARVLCVMPAVTLVDIAALDLSAGKLLGILDDLTQGAGRDVMPADAGMIGPRQNGVAD